MLVLPGGLCTAPLCGLAESHEPLLSLLCSQLLLLHLHGCLAGTALAGQAWGWGWGPLHLALPWGLCILALLCCPQPFSCTPLQHDQVLIGTGRPPSAVLVMSRVVVEDRGLHALPDAAGTLQACQRRHMEPVTCRYHKLCKYHRIYIVTSHWDFSQRIEVLAW